MAWCKIFTKNKSKNPYLMASIFKINKSFKNTKIIITILLQWCV